MAEKKQTKTLAELTKITENIERFSKDQEENTSVWRLSERTAGEIAELRQAADAVHNDLLEEKAKLYRKDGKKRYSDAEHKERMDALTRRRDEIFVELKQRAEQVSAQVRERLEIASKPERYLSDKDMERAAIRSSFVQEDVERLPLGEVPSLLREAELSSDRVEKWLAARYATIRADLELLHLRETGGAGVAAEQVSRELREIREAAGRLTAQLQPPGAGERKKKLEALQQQAFELQQHVRWNSITEEERRRRTTSPY